MPYNSFMKTILKNLYHVLVMKIMQSDIYWWLLMRIIPYIRLSMYYTSLRGWRYQRGYKLLKNGDMLCVVDKKKLTHYLIPGEFSHAALCVNIGDEWEISEMTHRDFTKSTFFDLCKEADRVCIVRCRDWDESYVEKVIVPNCKNFATAKYDVGFELGVKSLYCSELIYQSDTEKRLKCDLTDLIGLGRLYISPTGIYEAKNVDIIWDSDKEIPAPGFW